MQLFRVLRVARRPAHLVRLKVIQAAPLHVRLEEVEGAEIPQENARLYVQLLMTSFEATSKGSNIFDIEPSSSDPRSDDVQKWRNSAKPEKAMNGSPGILFPLHQVSITIDTPQNAPVKSPATDFVAGSLILAFTAADNVKYVDSPTKLVSDGLKGNESEPETLTLAARRIGNPKPLTLTTRILWAKTASEFSEQAEFQLEWHAYDEASHYEVQRVLEGRLDLKSTSLTDDELRSIAKQKTEVFELRSNRVLGARYTDLLPGRAPTRAFYRIRAINLAGEAGEWSKVLGPVRVPDMRQPPAPNLLRVFASPLQTNDKVPLERRITVEWV